MILFKPFRVVAMVLGCLVLIVSCNPEENDENFTPEEMAGTYNCAEKSEMYGSQSFEVIVNKSSEQNQITINNFYHLGSGVSVKVNISGSKLVVPQQVVNNIAFSGDGTIINENRMNLSFTADDGGGVVDVVSAGISR